MKKVKEDLVCANSSKCETQGSEVGGVMGSTPTKDVVGNDGEPVTAQRSFNISKCFKNSIFEKRTCILNSYQKFE
mgnify:CR=1 FL=1